MNKLIRVAAAPSLAATMLLLLPTQDAQAQRLLTFCRWHAHEAEAWGGSRYQGLREARARWQTRVRSHDGLGWASYSTACDKNERCSGRSGLYRCFVSAKPARPRPR
jgi:hypothetical protein